MKRGLTKRFHPILVYFLLEISPFKVRFHDNVRKIPLPEVSNNYILLLYKELLCKRFISVKVASLPFS